jgi:hypothetical protein
MKSIKKAISAEDLSGGDFVYIGEDSKVYKITECEKSLWSICLAVIFVMTMPLLLILLMVLLFL